MIRATTTRTRPGQAEPGQAAPAMAAAMIAGRARSTSSSPMPCVRRPSWRARNSRCFAPNSRKNISRLIAGIAMLIVAAIFGVATIVLLTSALVEWIAVLVGSDALAALIVAGGDAVACNHLRPDRPQPPLADHARAEAHARIGEPRRGYLLRQEAQMSRRIEEIEADVARSRARLEQTLQRIEHKLSASGMVDDALASLRRTRHGDVVDRAMGALRDNPVPVLAVMAGIGWLIGRAGSAERDAARAARARERAYRREANAASKDASNFFTQ